MSEVNTRLTIPEGVLGGKTARSVDHGPFYFFSAATLIPRIDMRDSVARIEPCQVVACTDYVEYLPEEQCPTNGSIVDWKDEYDLVGTRKRYGAFLKPAYAIAETIHEMYDAWGVQEIKTFEHLGAEDIDLTGLGLVDFNFTIYPMKIEPWLDLDPDIADICAKEGGLEARRRSILSGRYAIEKGEFVNQFGREKQRLYLQAIDEILGSFYKVKSFLKRELDESDSSVRLRLGGSDGKPTYDPRDAYFQWLLARPPINETQRPGEVVVQLPEGLTGQGLTKEDLMAVLKAATEHAVQVALASQRPQVAIPLPEAPITAPVAVPAARKSGIAKAAQIAKEE